MKKKKSGKKGPEFGILFAGLVLSSGIKQLSFYRHDEKSLIEVLKHQILLMLNRKLKTLFFKGKDPTNNGEIFRVGIRLMDDNSFFVFLQDDVGISDEEYEKMDDVE